MATQHKSSPTVRIAQMMNSKPPKLTKALQKAGIIEIGSRNFNGSYVCVVDLRKVDLMNTKSNPRRHSQIHTNKLLAAWMDESVRNPVLRFKAGKINSIDGRHTAYAILVQTCDNDVEVRMTCDVHFNITDAKAAQIFYNLTVNNKRISPWDAFQTALQGEMGHALFINRVLNSYCLTTPNSEGCNNRTCDISSYTPIQEAYAAMDGTLETLCFILDQTYRQYGRVAKDAKDVEFLRGLIDLIQHRNYHGYSSVQFVSKLMRRTAAEVDKIASGFADNRGETRPNRQDYCQAFVQVMRLGTNKRAA